MRCKIIDFSIVFVTQTLLCCFEIVTYEFEIVRILISIL